MKLGPGKQPLNNNTINKTNIVFEALPVVNGPVPTTVGKILSWDGTWITSSNSSMYRGQFHRAALSTKSS